MTTLFRIKRKTQKFICPYDDIVSQLKGGLQNAPKWLNSVRKYPPEKMHLFPGKLGRPAQFFDDDIRKILLNNRERPDWIPSLYPKEPQIGNIMANEQFQDAFNTAMHSSDSDVEFAACQAWFMKYKNMKEDEAYEQARFRMRDLLKQKQRIWEVYRRVNYMSKNELKNERSNIVNSWTNNIRTKMKSEAVKQIKSLQLNDIKSNDIIKGSSQSRSVVPNISSSNNIENEKMKKILEFKLNENEFNRDWDDRIKLVRFIEYTDYIAKNPHLGLKDPTELLNGIPKSNERDREIAKKLLQKMSKKEKRLKFLRN